MDFNQKLENYAELLVVHGMNVQPGQIVNLAGESIHQDFLNRVLIAAYKRGAKYVNVDLIDMRHLKERVAHTKDAGSLDFVPKFVPEKYHEILDTHGAVLRIVGSEDPDLLSELPADKMNQVQLSVRKSLKRYYQEGVSKSKIHWTVAAAATPKWGKKIYPKLSEEEAYKKLWEDIFKICRVDKPDYLKQWHDHNDVLQKRASFLTNSKIKELHFTGPGTDLRVYLSPKAKFKGGNDKSPLNVFYEPNIPTEECFTTPDWRLTEGKARVTRPFIVNGKLIEGLELTFEKGILTHFKAKSGGPTFEAYINSDEGGRKLGEVALVGTDSPIFQSGNIFQEILFDENAACHIAVGSAYRFCLEGGNKMTDAELQALGCNDSSCHVDMMISSEEVDVEATTYDGKRFAVIRKGQWVSIK